MRDDILSENSDPLGADASTGQQDLTPRFFTQRELARRWRLSGRTLEKWRWTKQGPAHLKLGGRIVYRLADIEAFEAEQRRTSAVG